MAETLTFWHSAMILSSALVWQQTSWKQFQIMDVLFSCKKYELLIEKITPVHMISLHCLKTVYMAMDFVAFQKVQTTGTSLF